MKFLPSTDSCIRIEINKSPFLFVKLFFSLSLFRFNISQSAVNNIFSCFFLSIDPRLAGCVIERSIGRVLLFSVRSIWTVKTLAGFLSLIFDMKKMAPSLCLSLSRRRKKKTGSREWWKYFFLWIFCFECKWCEITSISFPLWFSVDLSVVRGDPEEMLRWYFSLEESRYGVVTFIYIWSERWTTVVSRSD